MSFDCTYDAAAAHAAHTHRQEEAIQLVAAKDKACQSSQVSMRDPAGGGGGHEGEAHHPLHEGAVLPKDCCLLLPAGHCLFWCRSLCTGINQSINVLNVLDYPVHRHQLPLIY